MQPGNSNHRNGTGAKKKECGSDKFLIEDAKFYLSENAKFYRCQTKLSFTRAWTT